MIYILIFLAGVTAGFMNTLAGGGSTLTIPVLILAGVPANLANTTNRIAIWFQTGVASAKFHKKGKLSIKPYIHITISAIIGAVIGSFYAIEINSANFEKVLSVIFVLILILMFKPKKFQDKVAKKIPKWAECLIFLLVGLYGGFIQAGVGFIFLASLNLVEKSNLVEANATKSFIIFVYTTFAFIIFIISGKIMWKLGLLLTCGNVTGAYIGVNTAIKGGEKVIRIVIVIAVVLAILKMFDVIKI